jgi:hypothetical protein
MGVMIPELTEQQLDDLPSAAEGTLYRALRDQLSSEYVTYFQIKWILKRQEEGARDGESDFVVCHPALGFLCVEAKGGGVAFDARSGVWSSVDRTGTKHLIKDPIKQALGEKYSILSKLKEHPRWRDLRLPKIICGHAAFFPDISSVKGLVRPDLPERLIGCARDLARVPEWVDGAFAYWHNEDKSQQPIGTRGLEIFREVFGRSFEIRPLLAVALRVEEQERIRLTREQARLLDILRGRRRVAISGGAGTGKTILAVEKARRLAAEGFRTLLTCYNRQLADHLASVCADVQGLDVMSFHQLCHRHIDEARRASGRDLLMEAKKTYPGADTYDVHYPNALSYALEILPGRYDAIVCDEGQDFADDYWVPLELLLAEYEQGPLYIFFDDNQNLYSRAATFPIRDEPYPLTINCRNTLRIHEAAYRYYMGAQVAPPSIPGEAVQVVDATNMRAQATKIHARIVDLIAKSEVPAGDIVVLVVDALRKTDYYEVLRHHPLPRPARWLEEAPPDRDSVLLETVNRFKGLEAPVVFLWGLDGIDLRKQGEQIYVGISRAKSMLFVAGRTEICTAVLAPS